ncbi:MAG: hypothetical protein KJ587_10235 [Alphaproteobacteria bacterium]|nr:hypothetical protein [Alphaproteobacteria bacterium]
MATLISPSTRLNAVGKFMIELGRELFGSYRPEKHYMRGRDARCGQAAGKDATDRGQERDQDLRRR